MLQGCSRGNGKCLHGSIDTRPILSESRLCVEVFRLDEVGHVFRLGWRRTVVVMAVSVVVRVRVLGRTNVVHLVGGTALHAARLGLVTGKLGSVSDEIERAEAVLR
jgi:hypothetical protein